MKIKVKRPMNSVNSSVDSVVEKLKKFQTMLGEAFQEREEVIQGILLALLTKQHVMFLGVHGTAKSLLGTSVFKAFTDSELFTQQFTKAMTEDLVFGIPNIKTMQEKGIIVHEVEGMLPTADFAFLEEFMDASEGVLRSTLDILNERQFRKGRQQLQCPLRTAIATTNFLEEPESVAAVLDRFLVKLKVNSLEEEEAIKQMLINYSAGKKYNYPTFSLEELDMLYEAVTNVRVEEGQIDLYIELLRMVVKQSGAQLFVSDRRRCWALQLACASAVLDGRDTLVDSDLEVCRYGLIRVGADEEEKWFEEAISTIMKDRKEVSIQNERLNTIEAAIEKISASLKKPSITQEELIALNKNAKTVQLTLSKVERRTEDSMASCMRRLDKLTASAEKLLADWNAVYEAWIAENKKK